MRHGPDYWESSQERAQEFRLQALKTAVRTTSLKVIL
jgi:hypothetical protein